MKADAAEPFFKCGGWLIDRESTPITWNSPPGSSGSSTQGAAATVPTATAQRSRGTARRSRARGPRGSRLPH